MKKGLTISFIFEAESANYGEGFGNISVLKKISRNDGKVYTYISRQALRYNIINQLAWDSKESVYKEGSGDSAVVQFAPNATIDKYPEIDLFGYMKTSKAKDKEKGSSSTRSAVVRLSNAVSLESYNSDTDFLTNMGLAKRIDIKNNIAQSEIHKSFYSYTITIDLDRVGVDGNIEIDNSLKAERIIALIDTIATLYRDIKGRRENLAPIFAIGGLYDRKNPFFENRLVLKNKDLNVQTIQDVMNISEDVKENTECGIIKGLINNTDEIISGLNAINISQFYNNIKRKVNEYYESFES